MISDFGEIILNKFSRLVNIDYRHCRERGGEAIQQKNRLEWMDRGFSPR
jgi:hypothetical protein